MIKRIQKFFVTTFIGGALVILPLTLLVLIFRLLFDFIRQLIQPISSIIPVKGISEDWLIDLIAVAIVILFCFLLGLFVQTQFGKRFFAYVESQAFLRLPFYSTIKETVQQFAGKKEKAFSQVVLVRAFDSPMLMTGFITDEHADGYYTVFCPTGPNPTNGYVFHVRPEQVEYLDVKIEDAMRTIIGVGAGSARLRGQGKE